MNNLIQNTNLSLEEAMRLAAQYQDAGQLQQAEMLLRTILDKYPNQPDALHLLGVVAYSAGQITMALELIAKAISINDKVALFHSNYGEMCRLTKDYREAIIHGEKAVALDPTVASTHSNLGIAYFDDKNIDRAQACQMRALSIDPNFPPALNNMGSIFREKKMFIEAMSYYEKAFHASGKQYIEALCNLGSVLIEEDRAEEAFPVVSQVLTAQPNHPEAWCSLGGIYVGRENTEKAYACFSNVLAVVPDHATALGGMARVFQDHNQLEDSLNYVNRAIELDPTNDTFYMLRAGTYQELGKVQEAVADYDKAFELRPEVTNAIVSKARLFLELGDFDKANQFNEQALSMNAEDIAALSQSVAGYKVQKDDPNMATLLTLYQSGAIVKANEKVALHFALGKCCEDIGEYDEAFQHFLAGNALKREMFDYDAQEDEARSREVINTFTADYIKKHTGYGHSSAVPIFIVGMPRSGTTLVEQIISSHPSVYGAGELHYLPMVLMDVAKREKISIPDMMKSLTAEMINHIGTEYLANIKKLNSEAPHITDKMPSNYIHVGLIHLVFPNAKIIHLQRNPLDVCLSAFSRLFHRGQHHSYNLVEQGRHYRDYGRVMQHWRNVLPPDAFFDIRYEDLIDDTDKYARQLISYCGLAWDDNCLAFYESKRRVKTASIMQVRQPIYKTSVEKWRRYEKHLGPLREALGEFNPS